MAEADPAVEQGKMAQHARHAAPAPIADDLSGDTAGVRAGRRRNILMFSVPVLILAAGSYAWAISGRSVSTDNAYVKQNIVSVSSDVGGRIVRVMVRENQIVKAGQPGASGCTDCVGRGVHRSAQHRLSGNRGGHCQR
jgi:membrane fusion protein (multidrug efflux system)